MNDGIEKVGGVGLESEEMKGECKVLRCGLGMVVEGEVELVKSEDWD